MCCLFFFFLLLVLQHQSFVFGLRYFLYLFFVYGQLPTNHTVRTTEVIVLSDNPFTPPPTSLRPSNTPGRELTGHAHNRGSRSWRQWRQLVKRPQWLTTGRYHFWPLAELVEAPWGAETHSYSPFLRIKRSRCYPFQYYFWSHVLFFWFSSCVDEDLGVFVRRAFSAVKQLMYFLQITLKLFRLAWTRPKITQSIHRRLFVSVQP